MNILNPNEILEQRLAKIGEKLFHIHLDLFEVPDTLRTELESLGFEDTSFSGHPEGYDPHLPPLMLTIKTNDRNDFRRKWNEAERILGQSGVIGYGESEALKYGEMVPNIPYSGASLPFEIYTRKLQGPPKEKFRETEFHLEFDSDRSNPELIKRLLEAGLYGAFYNEPDGSRTLTLTMQGYIKNIKPLMMELTKYLKENGGLYNCSIIEEKAVLSKLAGIAHAQLPSIADRVVYFNQQA